MSKFDKTHNVRIIFCGIREVGTNNIFKDSSNSNGVKKVDDAGKAALVCRDKKELIHVLIQSKIGGPSPIY